MNKCQGASEAIRRRATLDTCITPTLSCRAGRCKHPCSCHTASACGAYWFKGGKTGGLPPLKFCYTRYAHRRLLFSQHLFEKNFCKRNFSVFIFEYIVSAMKKRTFHSIARECPLFHHCPLIIFTDRVMHASIPNSFFSIKSFTIMANPGSHGSTLV